MTFAPAISKSTAPMLLTLVKESFSHAKWQYEFKYDGFRCMAHVEGNEADLRSKNNLSFNKRFCQIKSELEQLNLDAVLDGEIVYLHDGRADFD